MKVSIVTPRPATRSITFTFTPEEGEAIATLLGAPVGKLPGGEDVFRYRKRYPFIYGVAKAFRGEDTSEYLEVEYL